MQNHLVEIEVGGVMFDSDGVLVDSHEPVAAAWRQLSEEFDLAIDIDSLLVELVGVRAVDTLARCLPAGEVEDAAARLEDLEVETAPQTLAIAGAAELLDALPAGSWTIVTSASRRLALARWHGAGLPVPDRVVTADEVSRGKPDPEPFCRGSELLGFDPAECVVFEDSPSGALAGRSAGADVVAVGDQPWDFVPRARVADLHAVRVIDGGGRLRLAVESMA